MEDQIIKEAEDKAKTILIIAEDKAKLILKDAAVLSDEKIKEFLFQAIQSGKKETSGLVDTLIKKIEEKKAKDMTQTLDTYFDKDRKYIDASRIPLICQDIATIHDAIEKIQQNLTWIVRLVIGGVVAALLGLILK